MSKQNAQEITRLINKSNALVEIVEGFRGCRWADPRTGKRLVDTPEWCAFYCAVKGVEKAK